MESGRIDSKKKKMFATNGRIHLVKKSVSTLGRLLIDLFLCGGPRSYQVLATSVSIYSNGQETKITHLVAPSLDSTGHVNDFQS